MNETATRKKWRMWSGVITVFVVGMIVGGLSATVLIRSHVLHVMRSGPSRPHERIAERLTGNLGLTSDQRTRVEEIMREFEPRFREFEQRSRAEVRGIADSMEARIRETLNPDQRVKYDASLERMREDMLKRRHRDHGHRRGGRGGSGGTGGAGEPGAPR